MSILYSFSPLIGLFVSFLCGPFIEPYIQDPMQRNMYMTMISTCAIQLLSYLYANADINIMSKFMNKFYNHVNVSPSSPQYRNITDYIKKKFNNKIHILEYYDKNNYAINESKIIVDTYNSMTFYITVTKSENRNEVGAGTIYTTKANIYVISSRHSFEKIYEYISHITDTTITHNNLLTLCFPNLSSHDIARTNNKQSIDKTSQEITNTIENTIIEEYVQTNLLDDIREFLNNKKEYTRIGIPYKRGYMLYGMPGTGKTTCARLVASTYNLPVYTLDLSILTNNQDLNNYMKHIYRIQNNMPYILLIEDIDRCEFIIENNEPTDIKSNKITADCLLNILDGLFISSGRITITGIPNKFRLVWHL
jgi:ATP-dependent 26S proteasome regulatory subunit